MLLVTIGLSSSFTAQAGTIDYVATDLADTTPGEDLWRYDYTVSGINFLQGQFFDIYFSPASYGALTAALAPNPDWDVLILQQPTPGNLPPFDTGIFNAFALVNGASVSGTFSVDFVYLGAGTPGSQRFEIFDANAATLQTGITSVPGGAVPEPGTAALLLLGAFACAIQLHRRSAIRH